MAVWLAIGASDGTKSTNSVFWYMNISTKVSNAYRRGGIKEVSQRGIDVALDRFGLYDLYMKKRRNEIEGDISHLEQHGIGQRFNEDTLRGKKSSSKIFVLGSGSSINEITREGWAHIQRHDSVGLNRWPVHQHVPTYYVFEMPTKPHTGRQLIDLLQYRRDAYTDTPIILKDTSRFKKTAALDSIPEWLLREIVLSLDILLPPFLDSSENSFRSVLQHLDRHDYLQPGSGPEVLLKKRGSISYLLFLAVSLGYDEIILSGVDLTDSKYFWENNDDDIPDNVPVPELDLDRDSDDEHKVNDPDIGIPLETVIYDINDVILEPNGIDLYTATRNSALYPELPHYDIDSQMWTK